MQHPDKNYSVVLFDGLCNLCNASINFIIKHDKKGVFKFASLQSDKGKELLEKYAKSDLQTTTIVLIENNKVYIKSTAALKIAKQLNGLYPLLYLLLIVPPFIRNGVYDFIAKRRYIWFGKQDVCMIPSGEIQSKFIL